MKILKIFIIIFLCLSIIHLESDEKNDELKNKILKNIRCLICQGQSVYDSESDFASSIKLTVDRKINEGLKEKQIYQFLREKYGEWVIYDPQLNKNTYILWLLPLLLFLFGCLIGKFVIADGLDIFQEAFKYVTLLILVLFIHAFVTYSLILINMIFMRVPLILLIKKVMIKQH